MIGSLKRRYGVGIRIGICNYGETGGLIDSDAQGLDSRRYHRGRLGCVGNIEDGCRVVASIRDNGDSQGGVSSDSLRVSADTDSLCYNARAEVHKGDAVATILRHDRKI